MAMLLLDQKDLVRRGAVLARQAGFGNLPEEQCVPCNPRPLDLGASTRGGLEPTQTFGVRHNDPVSRSHSLKRRSGQLARI